MLQPVAKVVLSVLLLCVLHASTGARTEASTEVSTEASAGAFAPGETDELAPLPDDGASPQLTCGGHTCLSGQQCCSCRATPSSPLTFFCHTPDYCPHGSICQIPPP